MKKILIPIVLLLVASLLGNGYLANQIRLSKQDPTEINQKDITDTVNRVSKLMILPTDEVPTLATVSDPEKLRGQAFFANAKVGYKVLVYTKAQKAILYDPNVNKIVEVAPIGANPGTETSIPVTESAKKK